MMQQHAVGVAAGERGKRPAGRMKDFHRAAGLHAQGVLHHIRRVRMVIRDGPRAESAAERPRHHAGNRVAVVGGVVVVPGRRPDPQIPIQPRGHRLGRQRRVERNIGSAQGGNLDFHPQGEGRLHFAQPAPTYELAHLADAGNRTVLRAGLENARVAADRLDHFAPLANRERNRLFAIHMLARLRGVNGLQGVPVIRRRDDHPINIRPRQQFPVIVDGRAAVKRARLAPRRADFVHPLRPLLPPDAVHVAHGHQLRLRMPGQDAQMPAAHRAQADQPDLDALAGRHRAVPAADGRRDNHGRRQQGSGAGAQQKGAARQTR